MGSQSRARPKQLSRHACPEIVVDFYSILIFILIVVKSIVDLKSIQLLSHMTESLPCGTGKHHVAFALEGTSVT